MQPLVNIHSEGKTVYLFERFDGQQVITTDDTLQPFFYEPDDSGSHLGYDGTKLRKIIVQNPYDIKKYRSGLSFSSDISFNTQYLIHKVDTIDKCDIKYFFLDIEVYAKEIPNVNTATQPISCVSIYNNLKNEIKTWWILDYPGTIVQQEKKLLDDVLTYFAQERPDLMLSWNVDFDYTYLYNRCRTLYNKKTNFAENVSPINMSRYGNSEYPDVNYPAGISIMDYLAMFKKVFMREPSYTLDAVSQKYLNDESWGSSNFGELTQDIRDKNVNDVVRLKKLEEKFKIIEYFNEIRILTKTQWEDLCHNSFIIENLLFQEAKKKNIVLPNRPRRTEEDEESTFEGAAREALKTGALFDIGKFDLTSAYPTMMVEFCLDSANIVKDGSGLDINGVCFKQDSNALIPSMVKNIMELKDKRKAELQSLEVNTPEYTIAQIKYDAIKGVVNSTFGAMGFSSFRLYDNRIASSITYLVRDLLSFTRNQVQEKLKHDVIYWDTDSVFITCKDNICKELNSYVQDWARIKGKQSINLSYDYEGYFEKIFIIALCRYIGHLVNKKGKKKVEIKGAEAKRANSTKYEGKFQQDLIERILNKESRESIVKWVDSCKKTIKQSGLEEIAFPCKSNSKQPIVLRAIANTNSLRKLNVVVGEVMWWIYVVPKNIDVKGKEMDVFAFTRDDKYSLSKQQLNWDEIIRRNIQQKAIAIFEANNWPTHDIDVTGQLQLI